MEFKDNTRSLQLQSTKNNHLELKNPIQNDRKDSTTVVKRGYYKNLKQTLCYKDAKILRKKKLRCLSMTLINVGRDKEEMKKARS